jgi:small subunit ribosomal protein S21
MEIRVEGSLDQALRVLKRKLAKEGVLKEWRRRTFYEKPSVRRKHKREVFMNLFWGPAGARQG